MVERFTITMDSSDIDLFERKRCEIGMSKSAFIRLLISEYDNKTPNFIKHKEIIKGLSEINTSLKEIIISEEYSDVLKINLLEKINNTNQLINEFLKI